MATLLSEYLADVLHGRVVCNCLTFGANWVQLVTGRDPASSWRPSAGEAADVAKLRTLGGARRVVASAMDQLGFMRTIIAQPGDVALARVVAPHAQLRLICSTIYTTHATWAVKHSRGLAMAGPPAVKPFAIWRVFDGH